jgi:S-formylglutathione hydrolase FrmB
VFLAQIAAMNRCIRLYFLLIASVVVPSFLRAASVDTVSVYSNSMHKQTRCVVIQPSAKAKEQLPVLYLLHGLGGDHQSWLNIKPELPQWADKMGMIIVCPNGGVRSWYLDSPVDTSFRYETYMTQELIPFIDEHYPTIRNRSGRAIAGLSMGGHGSLFLAIRHSELFGAACSTSGSVDLLKKTFSWKYKEMILGDTVCCKQNWLDHSIVEMTDEVVPDRLFLHLDCGTEDDLYAANVRLHNQLTALNIRHEYKEGPGKHDAVYWNKSIEPILQFVSGYFNRT